MPYLLAAPPPNKPTSPPKPLLATDDRSIAHIFHCHGWRVKHVSVDEESGIMRTAGILELHDYGFVVGNEVLRQGRQVEDRMKQTFMWYSDWDWENKFVDLRYVEVRGDKEGQRNGK